MLHLNNGSFGATPAPIAQLLAAHRELVDRDRDRFFRRVRADAVGRAVVAAQTFLNAPAGSLAFVPNASAGITDVLRSFPLAAGDEILVTDHGYPAARLAADEVSRRGGVATVRVAAVPLAATAAEVVDAIVAGLTPRTRLAIIDHVTSPTAEVWPVNEIVAALHARNVAVLVDAAHAPGMIPVDVTALGADFWVGNFHKWGFSGLTVAALVVQEQWRAHMRAAIVSHEEPHGFPESFHMQGTLDYSVICTLHHALALLTECDWQALAERNRTLAAQGAAMLADALGTEVVEGAERASMSLLRLPDGPADDVAGALVVQAWMEDQLRTQTSIVSWHGQGFLRLSVQGYVTESQIREFADRLMTARGRLLELAAF
jgi:isopenicillin-N epimerase